jgi:hypothetical protein
VIAGEFANLRRVAWAHVSDLEDPTLWLCGSKMIMATGMGPRSAQRQSPMLSGLRANDHSLPGEEVRTACSAWLIRQDNSAEVAADRAVSRRAPDRRA